MIKELEIRVKIIFPTIIEYGGISMRCWLFFYLVNQVFTFCLRIVEKEVSFLQPLEAALSFNLKISD